MPKYSSQMKTKATGKSILIVRHAESVANVKGVLAGRMDPTPLTSKGRSAAKALSSVVENFDPETALSSPLLRCRQTFELASTREARIDERLIEMDYGSWSGRSLKVLSRRPEWRSIQKDPSGFTFPKGESFTSAAARVTELLTELHGRPEKRILIVSHGDICRILINTLLDRTLNSFQKILIEPGSHSLLMTEREGSLNYTATLAYLNRVPVAHSTTTVKKFQLGGE